jgi:Predicted nucleic acid-binding protein, contains PIN domain
MLLDSNIVIYAVKPGYAEVRNFVNQHDATVSAITRVETLGYHDLGPAEADKLARIFDLLTTQPVTDLIIERSSNLRRKREGMATVDAIIAATALQLDVSLATHDTSDFEWISELNVVDPLSESS